MTTIDYFCTNCISDVDITEYGVTHKCECFEQPIWYHIPYKHWISYKFKEEAINNILVAYGHGPEEGCTRF